MPKGSPLSASRTPPIDLAKQMLLPIAGLGTLTVVAGLFLWQPADRRQSNIAWSGLTAEETAAGIVVTSVRDSSEAARGGVSSGDLLVAINGATVHHLTEANTLMRDERTDDVRMDLVRDNHRHLVVIHQGGKHP